MYFKILGHILQSRVYKSFPFIYNGCHCKIFEKNLSSFAKVVLSSKPKFTHLQGSLVYPVQFLENNCNVYLYNTQFVRLKSSKSKKSKTQDDKVGYTGFFYLYLLNRNYNYQFYSFYNLFCKFGFRYIHYKRSLIFNQVFSLLYLKFVIYQFCHHYFHIVDV